MGGQLWGFRHGLALSSLRVSSWDVCSVCSLPDRDVAQGAGTLSPCPQGMHCGLAGVHRTRWHASLIAHLQIREIQSLGIKPPSLQDHRDNVQLSARCSDLGAPGSVPGPQFPPLHHGAPCALCVVPGGLGSAGHPHSHHPSPASWADGKALALRLLPLLAASCGSGVTLTHGEPVGNAEHE